MNDTTRAIIQWAKRNVKINDRKEIGVEDILVGLCAEAQLGHVEPQTWGELHATEAVTWSDEVLQSVESIRETPDIPEDVKYPMSSELRAIIHRVHLENQELEHGTLVRHLLSSDHPWVAGFREENRGGRKKPSGTVARLEAISRKTGELRKRLNEVVLGQRAAVDMLAAAYFRASVVHTPNTPQGIFTMMGPPGVGKTLLAETFATVLGEIEQEPLEYLKLDMSCYSSHQNHEQLFGFAKTYTNATAGILTEHVQKHPRTVLVFDEIEKAHYNTITALLAVLDRARAFDNKLNENVDFSQTWVVFTTNLGQEFFSEINTSGILHSGAGMTLAFDVLQNARKSRQAPGGHDEENQTQALPPEFVSRLAKGGGVVFSNLGVAEYMQLIGQGTVLERDNADRETPLPKFEIDPDVQFMFLLSLLPDVDARRVVANTRRWIMQLLQESFESCRDALRRHHAHEFSITLEARDVLAPMLRDKLQLEGLRLLIIDDDDYLPAMIEAARSTLVFDQRRISDRDDVESEVLRFNPDMILLDASIGEGADSSRVDQSLRILDVIRRTTPEIPVVLFSENPQNRANLDNEISQIMAAGGARAYIPLVRGEELQEGDFTAQVTARLRECELTRTFIELRKRHCALDYRIVWSFEPDANRIRGRVENPAIQTRAGIANHYDAFQFSGIPRETFQSVVGLERAKRRLTDVLDWLRNPEKLRTFSVTPPRGFLLAGPPGTGKTLLARALAGEARLPFLAISASELENKYVGGSEERIRSLFAKAREYAPSIVFIDEIDTVATRRGASAASGSEHSHRLLNQLLAAMDGFQKGSRPVFVLAATNLPDILDPALRRPGRFDEIIPIDLPASAARHEFFRKFLAPHTDMTDFTPIVSRTAGCSPAQLDRVVREAVYLAAREGSGRVLERHVREAVLLVVFGASQENMKIRRTELERTAWHEAGHAVALLTLFPDRKIEYASIVPSESGALGFVAPESDETKHDLTRADLERELQVKLAGQEAERLKWGDDQIGAGASNDIENANRLVCMALARWGMDHDRGPLSMAVNFPGYSEAVWNSLLLSAEMWLKRARQQVASLLKENQVQLDAFAQLLLERESLEWKEIEASGLFLPRQGAAPDAG